MFDLEIVEGKFPKCCIKHCPKDSAKHANGNKTKKGMCHGHYQAWWRHNNPLMSYFRSIKDHAKEREIIFTLTFEQFKSIVPVNWRSLTVDRIEGHKGYAWGNIQFMPFGENAAKGNRERWLPDHVKDILERKRKIADTLTKSKDPF